MTKKRAEQGWIEARGLFENAQREYLLVRPENEPTWRFPGDRLHAREAPEAALRRWCAAALGTQIEIVLGQPPFVHHFGTHSITYRYFVCRFANAIRPAESLEPRWVLRPQLRDYEFDAPTQNVVDWLLEEPE